MSGPFFEAFESLGRGVERRGAEALRQRLFALFRALFRACFFRRFRADLKPLWPVYDGYDHKVYPD